MSKSDKKVECPVCKGLGYVIKRENETDVETRRKAVLVLVKAGFSYRNICTMLGYKSPYSVQKIVEQHLSHEKK